MDILLLYLHMGKLVVAKHIRKQSYICLVLIKDLTRMSGIEEKLARDNYSSDETEGIIPRAIRYLWQSMGLKEEQFYVKASYTEIYNEQLRDLLNPASGILHMRWNATNVLFYVKNHIIYCI